MTGLRQLYWRGEPIRDVDAWAQARNEEIVRFVARRWVPDPTTNRLENEEFESEAPASLFDNLVSQHGWQYIELGRRAPHAVA